jgi:lipopolysaccharide export system protein LptA
MFVRSAAAALLVALAASAPAQTRHDSDAPVQVASDRIELQDRANRAVLSGHVKVRQGEMTLDTVRLTVTYTGQVSEGSPQISRLDAAGSVTLRRPDQTARSSFAVYDLNRRVLTMVGAVTLNQGGNTVNGGRLTLNMDTGRAVIDGSSVRSGGAGTPGAVTTAPSGRVTGTFSVPKRN